MATSFDSTCSSESGNELSELNSSGSDDSFMDVANNSAGR